MKFEWHIEPSDIEAVKAIVWKHQDNPFVIDRTKRNVDGVQSKPDRNDVWYTLIMCLVTTQQRSSSSDPVGRLLDEIPFPLSLEKCRETPNLGELVRSVLRNKGIYRQDQIVDSAVSNLQKLDDGGWEEIFAWIDKLEQQKATQDSSNYLLERDAARYIM